MHKMKLIRLRKSVHFGKCALFLVFLFTVITIKVTLFPDNHYKAPIEDGSHVRIAYSQQPCKRPQLLLDDPQMAPFYHSVAPLECDRDQNWVCVRPGSADKVGLCEPNQRWRPSGSADQIQCTYRFLERVDDDSNRETKQVTVDGNQDVKVLTDFFHVNCHHKGQSDDPTFRNTMATIARNPVALNRQTDPGVRGAGLGLNVLIMGFDSLSRLTFMRKLPKTYDYLVTGLGAVVLEGYNIVGDGTPQALIPMFTGKTELELPETRRRKFFTADYVNVYPFIWNDFRDSGYVTGYSEDSTTYSAFNYRLKGFDQQPTDHYMRPFYIEVDKVVSDHRKLCLGGHPRHKVWLDWAERFHDAYAHKPTFFFGFHGELSHDDSNLIEVADEDVVTFLRSVKSKGYLNNTVLIFMSDHGHRFSSVRGTQQGKLEERLPFFSLVLPEWFRTKHRTAWQHLQTNVQRLTSPFDIYATLRDVIRPRSENVPRPRNQRSISLFDEIPLHRTCADAGIEPHWCTCLNWGMVSTGDPLVQRAAHFLIQFINKLTATRRHLCHELQLDRLVWAERYAPSSALLQFKQSWDFDGFEAEFGDQTAIKDDLYQIQIRSSPGDALYEATVSYLTDDDKFAIKSESISRINKYENRFVCLKDEDTETDLRKYCYCKSSE